MWQCGKSYVILNSSKYSMEDEICKLKMQNCSFKERNVSKQKEVKTNAMRICWAGRMKRFINRW